jgi:hypothetical protein
MHTLDKSMGELGELHHDGLPFRDLSGPETTSSRGPMTAGLKTPRSTQPKQNQIHFIAYHQERIKQSCKHMKHWELVWT